MRVGSVCSGIGAPECAWRGLGWDFAWCSEIEKFPSAVLAHHFPDVPNLGDFTKIGVEHGPVELLVGGTPCQSFSVAGKRAGLDDSRGNITMEFLALAHRLAPRWVVWENVPGVLSIDGGRTFGAFLGTLAELGYGFAYRVLDAQWFGVAQRRRRVFVVGHSGGQHGRCAAVLFERESLSGHPAPSREAGKEVAGVLGCGSQSRGWNNSPDVAGAFVPMTFNWQSGGDVRHDFNTSRVGSLPRGQTPAVAMTLNAGGMRRRDAESETFVTHTLRGEGYDASEDGTRRWNPLVGVIPPLTATNDPSRSPQSAEVTAQVETVSAAGFGIRRLTPRECERLQGFPDDWTLVPYRGGKPAADGPRYRAIGNSMAVPVMRWIGERMQAVESLAP